MKNTKSSKLNAILARIGSKSQYTIRAENRELRKLVREMYNWTAHKETKWARRAKIAIQKKHNSQVPTMGIDQ